MISRSHAAGSRLDRCARCWLFLVTPLSKNGVRLGQDGACRERTKSATGRDSRQVQVRLDAGRRVCAACRACGAGALRLACEAPARAAIRRGRRALRCAAALRLHRRPLPGGHALVRHAGLEPRTSRLRATTDSPHATALETGPLLTRASLTLGRTPGWEAGRLTLTLTLTRRTPGWEANPNPNPNPNPQDVPPTFRPAPKHDNDLNADVRCLHLLPCRRLPAPRAVPR